MRIINVNSQKVEEHEDGSFVLVRSMDDPADQPDVRADNIMDFVKELNKHDEAKRLASKLAVSSDDEDL